MSKWATPRSDPSDGQDATWRRALASGRSHYGTIKTSDGPTWRSCAATCFTPWEADLGRWRQDDLLLGSTAADWCDS